MNPCANAEEKVNFIALPPPSKDRDSDLFNAFDLRRTIREISCARLSTKQLSDLLWSACGINRRQGPFAITGRTAASASNSQEIQVYAVMPEGAFRYDPSAHALICISKKDIRKLALTPGQKNTADVAPLQLVYAVDLHKLLHTKGFDEPGLHDPEVQKSYYFVDTGLIAQNVYLYAAATGLAAWFHNCDREGLARELCLGCEQKVLFAQSVGYPDVP